MAFFKRERRLRPVQAGDPDYATVLASLTTPPGAARMAAARSAAAAMERPSPDRPVEYYVYDGEDGRPAAVVSVAPLASTPGVVEAWLAVDPALRNFGLGEQVWQVLLTRVKKLGATKVRSWSDQPAGLSFLRGHGFEATHTDGSDDGPFRVEAELAL